MQRIIKGLLSAICVVVLIMVLVYSLMDRTIIFAGDPNYSKMQSNARILYEQSRYQAFGYVDYTTYSDYIKGLLAAGEIDDATRADALKIGNTADKATETAAAYIEKFTREYEAQGYSILLQEDDITTGLLIQKVQELYENRATYIETMSHSTQMDSIRILMDLIEQASGAKE